MKNKPTVIRNATPVKMKVTLFGKHKSKTSGKPLTKKQGIANRRKSIIETLFGDFRVLGKTVHIGNSNSICRVSDETNIIEGNELFTLLDRKIQEFLVACVIELRNEHFLKGVDETQSYLNADKKAVEYCMNKYPKTKKIFWVFALSRLFRDKMNGFQVRRFENLLKVMKAKNDKGAVKYVKEYKKSVEANERIMNMQVSNPLETKVKARKFNVGVKVKLPKKIRGGNMKMPKLSILRGEMMTTEKNVTMRGNSNVDMEARLLKKHPQYRVIEKSAVRDNFGMGGFKYYQHFWVGLKSTTKKTSKKK